MKVRIMSLIIVTLSILVVPIVGLVIADNVSQKYDAQFQAAVAEAYKVTEAKVVEAGIDLHKLCSDTKTASSFSDACSYINQIDLLKTASFYTLILGLVLLVFIYLIKLVIGLNRARLAALFAPVATITIAVISISILLQGAILIYGFYIAEVVYTEHYHPKIIILLALGAIITSYALIKAAFGALKSKPKFVFSEKITSENGSKLINLVKDIANKIGSEIPTNIIVGIEPNFYITAGKVEIAETGEILEGTTMYLSLPFLSIFSKEELSAVIGHELGHFKGEDTVYSIRFYPAYIKLYNAINNVQQNNSDSQSIFSAIAVAPLSFVLNEFSTTERTIGRIRELEADKAGSSVNGSLPLISSLLKVSEYGAIWSDLRRYNIDTLNEGKIYSNLTTCYTDFSNNFFENLNFEASSETLLASTISHPTDTHPTIVERMHSLKIDRDKLNKELMKPSQTPLTDYIDDADSINESLTLQEHRLMINYGYAKLPEENENNA
jgi:Zn-dependent protease with chaperone function